MGGMERLGVKRAWGGRASKVVGRVGEKMSALA
jgi:hypothetical protein